MLGDQDYEKPYCQFSIALASSYLFAASSYQPKKATLNNKLSTNHLG